MCIMATSPTVLANVSSSGTSPVTPVAESAKLPSTPRLLAIAASVIVTSLGAGGGLYYLVHSGRFRPVRSAMHKTEAAVPITSHVILLEPMVVNLADTGGGSYLRIVVALRVCDSDILKSASPKEEKGQDYRSASETVAPMRDTLLTVLSRQTADDLLSVKGTERLKAAMKDALLEHNPDMGVQDVFFTDFLVQR